MNRRISVLLRLTLAVTFASPLASFAKTGLYDVSGDRGINDDPAARSYGEDDYAWPLLPGNNGGDALSPKLPDGTYRKQGRNAGTILLNLSATADATSVVAEGTKVEQDQRRTFTFHDSYPLSPTTSLRLRAKGGPGADGGGGGRGQGGGQGAPGSSAYYDSINNRLVPGGDGGQGAPGGDEGRSTDGGAAGRGGTVTVQTDYKDADLVMLLDEHNVEGNEGGKPGVGRGPGAGGFGGPGGSGAPYSRTVTRFRDKYGKNDAGEDVVVGQEPYEDTENGWIPGGNQGPRGPEGSRHRYQPKRGADSLPGEFFFRMRDKHEQWQTYRSLFRVAILPGYTLVGSHNGRYVQKKKKGEKGTTTFFEPGESITITGLRVINAGGAPTPEMQRVRLFLSDSEEWIVSDGTELVIPHSLAPGEEYSFGDRAITFHLRERERDTSGALRGRDILTPRARVERVEREFPNAGTERGAQTDLRVQYPIEINVVKSLVTIAPGEAQELTFSVKNVSNQPLGQSPEFANLRLAHTIYRLSEGTIREGAFVMAGLKADGYVVPVEGVLQRLKNLQPGKEIFFNAYVGFSGEAEHYTDVTIQPELFLERILMPGKTMRIEYRPHTITVAKPYVYHEDADVLVIANHGLRAPALKALEAVGSIMHLKFDIYDFSYYGVFDLLSKIEDYDMSARGKDYGSFFEGYRGKTLLIMGNQIETPGEHLRTTGLFRADRLIEAARRWGIKVVVMDTSGDAKATLKKLVEPTPLKNPAPEDLRSYTSFKHYKREMKTSVRRAQDDRGNDSEFLGVHRVPITRTQWFPWLFKPTDEYLKSQETKAVKFTDRVLPETKPHADRNHLVEELEPILGLFPQRNVGTVDIRFATDDAKTSVVVIPMPHDQLNNPDFIVSQYFQNALNMGLNFDKKLSLLNSIILGDFKDEAGKFKIDPQFADVPTLTPIEYAGVLIYSLLLDLLNEQLRVRPLDGPVDIPEKQFFNKLDSLRKVAYADYSQFALDPTTPEGELFTRLIVALRYFNKAITTPWQRWFSAYQSKNLQASFETARMLEYLVEHVFKDHENAKRVVEEQVKKVRQVAKERGITRDKIVEFLDPDDYRAYLHRDADVFRAIDERVRDPGRSQAVINDDERRADRAEDVRKAVAADNAIRRLKPDECEKFLAGRPVAAPLIPLEDMVNAATRRSPALVPRVPR